MMKASTGCINIIEACEGFSEQPYLCPAGVPTIGFGSTHYEDGRAVSLDDAPIDKARAVNIMMAELSRDSEPAVNRLVTAQINQDQFDALVDFVYNCGSQNLRTSTLLRKLNAGDYAGAAAEFDKWVHGGGRILPGLVKRRALERALFEGK